MFSRKLTRFLAAGTAAIAVAIGGFVIADSGSSSSANSGSSSSANAATGKVIPFQQGQPSPAKKVGRVPASFSPGTGTIITGTAADKAKAAAVAAYPGGIVNRVVRMSDGQYNVHLIGVNWPHHVFVTTNYKVVGAE